MSPLRLRTDRPPAHRRPAREWIAFGLGGVLGLAAGLLLRGRDASGTEGPSSWDRWSRALEDAAEGASEGWAAVRARLRPPEALDVEPLREALAGTGGTGHVRIRTLGEGIVEVAGSAASSEERDRILGVLSDAPGVEVVVNRIWTPRSASPEAPAGGSSG